MRKFFLCAISSMLLLSCGSGEKPAEQPAAATTEPAVTKTQPVDFADPKYTDIGKRGLAAMTSGNVDEWLNDFADTAKYYWNGGDSLIGKAAITSYWKKRRAEVIDSIKFTSEIWLPLKVNEPSQPVQRPGIWLLSWYRVDAKYKTGKSMGQWVHTDFHFDASDKIDQVIQYIDRAPINAVTQK